MSNRDRWLAAPYADFDDSVLDSKPVLAELETMAFDIDLQTEWMEVTGGPDYKFRTLITALFADGDEAALALESLRMDFVSGYKADTDNAMLAYQRVVAESRAEAA